jgi:hypothetical protein
MKNIAVSLVVDGGFKNVLMPPKLLGDLALKLRDEGKCTVVLVEEAIIVEGFVVSAKGSKNSFMVFDTESEGKE